MPTNTRAYNETHRSAQQITLDVNIFFFFNFLFEAILHIVTER